MAIRNEKLGGVSFNNGEVLYDYDLDDTFNVVAYRLIDSNETSVDNNTTSNVNAHTVTVGANQVNRFVDINAESRHFLRSDSSSGSRTGANNGIIDVYIGESGSEVLKKSFICSIPAASIIVETQNMIAHRLYYEPTISEKQNGFNIIFKLRVSGVARDGVGSSYARYNSSYVMGV